MPTQELAASFGRLAANHLWQSTGFAAVAVLLALALRANTARARYWLWLTASVKFLIPFSVLAAIGGSLGRWLVPTVPVSRFPSVIAEIVQPFTPLQDALLPAASVPLPATPALLPPVLLALWLCGFAAVLPYWWVRWRRVAAAVRASLPLTQGREVESLHRLQWGGPPGLPSSTVSLVSSTASLEPGIFGIFRPVLWLPAGIADRLDDAELEAILAHELCHVRRRDNLFAVIHMAVEAIFWFHPLVWWLSARLTEERERACDEEVVRMGGEPQVYAESILKVCEFYLASPVTCAAGVTGGELKKRIEGIMTNRLTRELSYGKKILLASAAILVVAGPIVVGLINAPQGRAQSQAGGAAPRFEVASVKQAPPPDGRGMTMGCPADPVRITCTNMNLANLVLIAYGIQRYQLSGLSVTDMDRFDIAVKVPEGATKDQVKLMWQNLLAERFKLAVHREMKEALVYELLVAKGGLKMQESVEVPPPGSDAPPPPQLDPGPPRKLALGKDGFPDLPSGTSMAMMDGKARWRATKETTEKLASMLAAQLGQPVTDATGLKGKYDFTLSWAAEPFSGGRGAAIASQLEGGSPLAGMSESEAGPTLFSAIQSQLGLRLEQKKGSIEMLVVDHVEKVPTEN